MLLIEFKSSDLVFLSKLDINIEVTAIEFYDDEKKKPYWTLQVIAENQEHKKIGTLHGARGEVRKFYQLNSVVEICKKLMGNIKDIKVKIK